MPYTTSRQNGRIAFVVDPDPLPPDPNRAPHLKLALGAVALVALFPILGGLSVLGLMVLLLYWFYKGMMGRILSGKTREVERVEWRRRYQFEADATGLSIAGMNIPTQDIHRIRILVGPGDEVGSSGAGLVYDMGTTEGRARAAGYQQGAAVVATLVPLTHRVQVEAKGIPYFVAGGVTSATAFAVRTELERALRGEI